MAACNGIAFRVIPSPTAPKSSTLTPSSILSCKERVTVFCAGYPVICPKKEYAVVVDTTPL